MTTAVIIEPHGDDGILSECVGMAHYAANVSKLILVTATDSGSGGVIDDLDGSAVCGWHGTHHNPAKEGYTAPAEADFPALRLAESRAALGTLAAAITGSAPVEHVRLGLPDGFGSQPDGVAVAQEALKGLLDTYADGNTFFHTMSPTELVITGAHKDHGCLGQGLRNWKNSTTYGSLLGGTRFFGSRLWWNEAAWIAEGPVTFPFTASRKAEYDRAIRMAAKCYAAWQPPQALGIGYHQVINQFYANGLDSQGNGQATNSITIENRWHD